MLGALLPGLAKWVATEMFRGRRMNPRLGAAGHEARWRVRGPRRRLLTQCFNGELLSQVV